MMENSSRAVPESRPLTSQQKRYMLAVLLRSMNAFEQIYRKQETEVSFGYNKKKPTLVRLSPEHFERGDDPAGACYSLVWQCTLDYYEAFHELPREEALISQMSAIVAELDAFEQFDDEQTEELDELIQYIYSLPRKEIKSKLAVHYAKQLLSEHAQSELQEDLRGDYLLELPVLLREHQEKISQISSLDSAPIPVALPERMDQTPLPTISPTGLPFFDRFMKGGHANGEVYTFVGPYGTCKTTIGVMLICEYAKRAFAEFKKTGKQQPFAYHLSWEETVASLRQRIYAYLARIPMGSLVQRGYEDNLSTAKTLKTYEKALFADVIAAGGKVFGEKARMKKAREIVNATVRLIDFTGKVAENAAHAEELENGMKRMIDKDQRDFGKPGVGLVVVDYAGAAVTTYMQRRNMREAERRGILAALPISAKRKIAVPYDCPVWFLHQASTQANAKSPTVVPDRTDVEGCHSFIENAEFGFQVGNLTNDNKCIMICSKQRRAARASEIILQVIGEYNRVEDASNRFILHNRQIVSKSDRARVVMSATQRKEKGDDLFDGVM